MATVARAFSLKAHAKLNLRLEVGRPKGALHAIVSVIADLELADELQFTPSVGGFSVVSDHREIPEHENLVWRAAQALPLPLPDVNIAVSKRIPLQAGLGGGSADAAAALRGLARIFKDSGTAISSQRLADAALRTGSDVPSCLVPGLKIVAGTGDQVTPRASHPPGWGVALLQPHVRSSTAQAYRLLDDLRIPRSLGPEAAACAEGMCAAFAGADFGRFRALLHNDFSGAVEQALPEVAQARRRLEQAGAQATILCGSGSCVAGFFPTRPAAAAALRCVELAANEWACATAFADGD